MIYLINVTVAWSLFLLLFKILYKNNRKFMTNRIYLLLSVAAGVLLPLISLPSNAPVAISVVQNFYTAAQSAHPAMVMHIQQGVGSVAAPVMNTVAHGDGLMLIVGIIYSAGVLVLLMKCLFELFKITRLILKNPVQILYSQRVITTGKIHSPYSFMGRIFLTGAASYNSKELEYIVGHEAAHNARKHWLDLWLLQLACIAFWFHPLIWRYRYLLQLQHEYEADAIAANKDPYNYGQFLLQQILLRGVPSIAHSFHFSPIKSRINMLTKKHSFKHGNWKYLLLVPALLGCTFLMAKAGPKVEHALQGNQMTFKGNTFMWRELDTLFYDKQKGYAELVPANTMVKPQVIVSMNGEPVYQNDHLQMPATYGNADTAFASYIIKEFQALRKNTADSLTYLVDLNFVIDKEGKIVYYNAHYARPYKPLELQEPWNTFGTSDIQLNILMDKVIHKTALWKPAMSDGKPVNSVVSIRLPGC